MDVGVQTAIVIGGGNIFRGVEGYPLEDWFSGTLTVVKELRLGTPTSTRLFIS